MYGLATTKADIYRGTTQDEGGDAVADNNPASRVVKRELASIIEHDSTVWDQVTQSPRVVRKVEMRIGSRVDVQKDDRVHDTRFGGWYVVTNVTRYRAAGKTPDTVCAMKSVGY